MDIWKNHSYKWSQINAHFSVRSRNGLISHLDADRSWRKDWLWTQSVARSKVGSISLWEIAHVISRYVCCRVATIRLWDGQIIKSYFSLQLTEVIKWIRGMFKSLACKFSSFPSYPCFSQSFPLTGWSWSKTPELTRANVLYGGCSEWFFHKGLS